MLPQNTNNQLNTPDKNNYTFSSFDSRPHDYPVGLVRQIETCTIKGTVVDDSGETLIGAAITVKGTRLGTVTNIDGKFSIEVPDCKKAILVTSYTGFTTVETPIASDKEMTIVLSEGVELDEVVVTGLGIKRGKESIGLWCDSTWRIKS